MDFKNFLRPYMITIYLNKREEGRYESGKWNPGSELRIPFRAAITTFSDDLLQFGDAGTYTTDDRKIFTYKILERGQKVEINGEIYTITAERDYAFYAGGLRMYVGRRDGNAHD